MKDAYDIYIAAEVNALKAENSELRRRLRESAQENARLESQLQEVGEYVTADVEALRTAYAKLNQQWLDVVHENAVLEERLDRVRRAECYATTRTSQLLSETRKPAERTRARVLA